MAPNPTPTAKPSVDKKKDKWSLLEHSNVSESASALLAYVDTYMEYDPVFSCTRVEFKVEVKWNYIRVLR